VTGLVGLASSAHGLTIVPTFDSSITSDPNGAAMMTAINAAIQVLQSKLTDNVTVKITFVSNEGIGLGQSETFGSDFSYADFRTALASHAASLNDTQALSHLPNSANDPVIGGTQIHLTTAQARLLGLNSYNGTDSTVSLKMSLMNLTRPPADLGKYDLQQVVEHEVDEVLGISSGLPDTGIVWPIDLFRYSTNVGGLSRTFTTSGDNAYFSVDGTNLLARFNMDSGGDYADYWSAFFPTNWSPITGNTLHFPQVQDAFSGPGGAMDLGVAELTALDVVGWTVVTAAPTTPPTLRIVGNGAGQATISWTNTATGFVLQERTNLVAGAWSDSVSGTSNPAVVLTSPAQKFYRLNKAVLLPSPAFASAVLPATHVSHKLVTRVLQPR